MPFRTKLVRGETRILAAISPHPGRIYTRPELAEPFRRLRREGTLAKSTTLDAFLNFLVIRKHLISVSLESKEYSKEAKRYCVGPPSPFALAASLRKNGYLSHGTAAYLHRLIKTPPPGIYLNVEQSAKPARNSPLSQLAIDRAFAGKQRHSKLSYENGNLKVMILAGKNTGRLGVEPSTHPEALGTKTTNLERTLIDVTVRPAYAGGIHQVLNAFEVARERVSAPALASILDQLNYSYPYAQAIGFLMSRASYRADSLEPFRSRVSQFKFHLAHGTKNPAYNDDWKLFIPKGL